MIQPEVEMRAVLLLTLAACTTVVQPVPRDTVAYTDPGAADPAAGGTNPSEPTTPSDATDGPQQRVDRDGDGWTRAEGDCDDHNVDIHPAAEEVCDGIDNDCDEGVDEDLPYARYYDSDYGADGVIDLSIVYLYDENGRMIGYDTDSDNDGLTDQSRWYIYDENGRLQAIHTDTDGDGAIDEIRSYFYDSDGRLVRIETDYGADGDPERIDTYVWDGDIYVQYRSDQDADGQPDMIYFYDWTPFGRVDRLRIEWYDAEGAVESANQYDYTYDENDRTDWVYIDIGADGEADTASNYEWSRHGKLHRYRSDTGADGVFDSQTMYKYDEQGRTRMIEIDSGIDGVNTRTTITYACIAE